MGCLTTCKECLTNSSCTSCRITDNRQLVTVSGASLCNCITGYHDQSSTLTVCITCDYSCITCLNSQSCTACADIRTQLNGTNSLCICPTQRYYDDGRNALCLRCSYLCLSCDKLSTNCTLCSLTAYRYKTL